MSHMIESCRADTTQLQYTAAVYQARPDIKAFVHLHTPGMISQTSSLLASLHSKFSKKPAFEKCPPRATTVPKTIDMGWQPLVGSLKL